MRCGCGAAVVWLGLWVMVCVAAGQELPASQQVPSSPVPSGTTPAQEQQTAPVEDKADTADKNAGLATSVWLWKGLVVEKILFEGVTFDSTDTLPKELSQKVGVPLDPEEVRASLRRLYASGRYRDISVRGVRQGDKVTLIFAGAARYYVGRVTIDGVKSERLTSLLEFATKLSPGTAFTESQVPAGTAGIKEILQQQGYYEPTVAVKTETDEAGDQINVTYTVTIGPQARVGQIMLVGDDTGLTPEEFRKRAKLKENSKVGRDTTSNALDRLRKLYQKKNRLEATVALQKQTYDDVRDKVDYEFHANQGPEVKVSVEGAKVSTSRLHLLVPIFEEGTIDNDLLNEGVFNIRDFEQQQGFFDAKVDVRVVGNGTTTEQVVFTVDRGVKHKVVAVDFKGNKYFTDDLLRERMRVQKSNAYQRSGRYSPALVSGDVSAIQALYRANGFDEATITTDVKDVTTAKDGKALKVGEIAVTFTIVEGPQQKFGTVDLAGVDASRMQDVRGLMNAQAGQPFSLVTLSGDRDTVLQYYLAHGFDQVKVEIKQTKEAADADKTDVSLKVSDQHHVAVLALPGGERRHARLARQQSSAG